MSFCLALEHDQRYGIAWYNRTRWERTPDGEKAIHVTPNKRADWVAVPVPDAGIPCELADAARLAIKDNHPTSSAGDRCWELSGGILHCGGCRRRMSANRVLQPRTKKPAHYYRCPTRQQYGKEA